ncbi:MAG: hypothetical protein ACI89D_001278 [Bermanella sp.]|jgi:hypothetical protein
MSACVVVVEIHTYTRTHTTIAPYNDRFDRYRDGTTVSAVA